MSVEHWWNDPDRGKLKQRTFYSATVSTINPTWTGLGSNAGLRGDRPAQPRNINSAHNGTTVSLLHDTNIRRTVLVQEGVTDTGALNIPCGMSLAQPLACSATSH